MKTFVKKTKIFANISDDRYLNHILISSLGSIAVKCKKILHFEM